MRPNMWMRTFPLRSALSSTGQRFFRRHFSFSGIRKETEKDTDNSDIVKPWYVVEAENQSAQASEKRRVELPPMPANSPELLRKVASYAAADMGLKDIQIIDRRERSELTSGALNPSFMVVGTGTSTRHLQSAGLQLLTWLKREFQIYADKEGILTTNYVRLHNKRQRRKQQRQRFSGGSNVEVLQRVGSWIVIDTKVDNIYVHLMTQERREEVDLEHLNDEEAEADVEGDGGSNLAADFVIPQRSAREGGGFSGRRGIHTSNRLPETREELSLENLVSEQNQDLTEDSTEVNDFVAHFPKLPSREDWKRRLRFFAVATMQSANFSLRRLVDEAETQQASGFVLDAEDVETVVTGICYHGQNHFAQLSRTEETIASWEQLCDYKAGLLSRVFEFALQPTSRSLVHDARLLVLLYRTFAGPSRDSISPEQALASPETSLSQKLDMFFDRRRLVPIRLLLEEKPEAMNVETVGMVLASLANGESFDAFWKVVNLVSLTSGSDKRFAGVVTELALALILKSGEREQIVHSIETFVPNMVLKKGIDLSPTLVTTLESALAAVSSGPTDGFASIRLLLEKYQKPEVQLE